MSWISNVGNNIKNGWNNFTTGVKNTVDGVVSGVQDVWNNVTSPDWWSNSITKVADDLQPFANKLGSAMDSLSEPFTHRQEMMDREDSVNQRTVSDMKAAGLNPAMFSGSAVTTANGASDHIGSAIEKLNGMSTLNQMKQQNWQLKQTNKIAKTLDISPAMADTFGANVIYNLFDTYNIDHKKAKQFMRYLTDKGIDWMNEKLTGSGQTELTSSITDAFNNWKSPKPKKPSLRLSSALAEVESVVDNWKNALNDYTTDVKATYTGVDPNMAKEEHKWEGHYEPIYDKFGNRLSGSRFVWDKGPEKAGSLKGRKMVKY